MQFNTLTYIAAISILIITALYVLLYSGLTSLLLCSSISLIIAAFVDQVEIVVALSVLFALFYMYFLKSYLKKYKKMIEKPHKSEMREMRKMHEVEGVHESFIEGFADADATDKPDETTKIATTAETEKTEAKGKNKNGEKAPASTSNDIDPDMINKVAAQVMKQAQSVTGATNTTGVTKQGFKNEIKSENGSVEDDEFSSATNQLFKLGKVPSEHKDGPMLDSGSTLLKAMSSFKPEQINAMSSDTKQLLETQKNLMNMLTQMRPVLADGKELLNTFSGMFGNGAMKL